MLREINGIGGAVEEINLRTIVLRDVEGVVHTSPTAKSARSRNRSKDFSYYVIDIGVGYDDDTDRIVEVVRDVGRRADAGPGATPRASSSRSRSSASMRSRPTEVTLRFRIKTLPLKQWEVGRELQAPDQEGASTRTASQVPGPSDDGDDQEVTSGPAGLRATCLDACRRSSSSDVAAVFSAVMPLTDVAGNRSVAFDGGAPVVLGADPDADALSPTRSRRLRCPRS